MKKYQLVRFDPTSANFAGHWAIQTSEDGKLIDVCDLDGDMMTYPGGPDATWESHFDLGSGDFWDAVQSAHDYAAVHQLDLCSNAYPH